MMVKDAGGGDFEQPEAGTYSANSYKLIDIGTQTGEYQGKPTVRRQVILGWELDEPMSDGRPFTVSKFYTASLSEKATLRHDLESWRGRAFTEDELGGFDLQAILGKPCMLTLTKTDKGKVKVTAVSKLPKGMQAMKAANPILYFSLDDFDPEVFAGLSDGIKRMIMQSPEYQAAVRGGGGHGVPDEAFGSEDDIPFAHCIAGNTGLGYALPGLAGHHVL